MLGVAGSLTALSYAEDIVDVSLPVEKPQYEWSKFALGVTYVYQQQDYELTSASFTLPVPFPLPPNAVQGIENTADTFTLKFSYTPYPFVTFFAVGGRVDGTVEVSVINPIGDITVDYDGWVYGGGVTLSYAYKHYFATVTGAHTVASLDDADIDTLVILPKVGVFNEKGALWIGAQYQRTEHSQAGAINVAALGGGLVTFDVDLEDEHNWNYLVGGRWNFTEDLSITAELGFSDRKQFLLSLERKF